MQCTYDGCTNETTAKGLCHKHYMRIRSQHDHEEQFLKHTLLGIVQDPEATDSQCEEATNQLAQLGYMPKDNAEEENELLCGFTLEENLHIWADAIVRDAYFERLLAGQWKEVSELEKQPFAEFLSEFSKGKTKEDVIRWRKALSAPNTKGGK